MRGTRRNEEGEEERAAQVREWEDQARCQCDCPASLLCGTDRGALIRFTSQHEFVVVFPDKMVQIRDTGLEGLNLGSRANTQARASGVERAMGVITGSRQSSPVPSTKDMTSRESTPMPVDEGAVMSSHADSEQSDSMEDTEDTSTQQILLELSVDYDEDADEDYEPTADTTLDEGCNRIDTSSDGDDDSFSDIDPNNIYESPYHDTDPLCMDRLTEEEKADIIDEARELGEYRDDRFSCIGRNERIYAVPIFDMLIGLCDDLYCTRNRSYHRKVYFNWCSHSQEAASYDGSWRGKNAKGKEVQDRHYSSAVLIWISSFPRIF